MGFWWVNLWKRHHFEDAGVDGRIICKCIFKKCDGGPWSGLIWLRIRICGKLLRMT